MNSATCSPANIYIIIAVIMTIVFLAVNFIRTPDLANNLGGIISWLCIQTVSILVCFMIIYGFCSINETLAWVSVIIIALSALSTFISILVNPTYYV